MRARDRLVVWSGHQCSRFEPDSLPMLLYWGPANAAVLNCANGLLEQPEPGFPTTLIRPAYCGEPVMFTFAPLLTYEYVASYVGPLPPVNVPDNCQPLATAASGQRAEGESKKWRNS